jgi:hypothetical protein
MDYIKDTLKTSSKDAVLNVANYLHENPHLISECFKLIYDIKSPTSWRICWTISHFTRFYPKQMKPYTQKLIDIIIENPNEDGLPSLIKALLNMGFDIEQHSELYDLALNLLLEPHKTSAKYYAIDLAMVFVKNYKELGIELAQTLEIAYDSFITKSLRNKAKLVIRQFPINQKDTKGLT